MTQPLRTAARAALLWGVSFTFLRDILQFLSMLVLVRLLRPEDYGRVALAQTVVGLISVASIKTFVSHALQFRDPRDIDWDALFSTAVVLNGAAFAVTLVIAAFLSMTDAYAAAALPLAALSLVFVIDIPANLLATRLQVEHRWGRYQVLMMTGVISGLAASLAIALAGGGYWALVAGVLVSGLPLAIDDVFVSRTTRHFVTDWPRHRGSFRFGLSRLASAGINGGRQMFEQTTMVNAFNFATLGIFTRSVGLATLAAGRIGPLVVSSLYPAITRVDAGSPQFRQVTGLILRGIAWLTIPASIFLGLNADDIVRLIYGPRWSAVAGLLPIAAAQVGVLGFGAASYNLLLANQNIKACMIVDVVSGCLGIVLALLLIPHGTSIYLAGLTLHAAAITALILFLLWRNKGIDVRDIARAVLPPLLAGAIAAAATVMADRAGLQGLYYGVALAARTMIFGAVVAGVLRFAMPGLLGELLATAPGGGLMRRALRMA